MRGRAGVGGGGGIVGRGGSGRGGTGAGGGGNGGSGSGGGAAGEEPGRFGAGATVEVAARAVGRVRLAYSPVTDLRADPGEVVWTWVPYEENDGRGKDRPVLVVAVEAGGTLLGLQLTSKPHDDPWDVAIGTGPWDASGRPSWVRLERVFRLQQAGIRRAGVALDARAYALVAAELTRRFGWNSTAPAAGAAAGRTSAAAPKPASARGSGSARKPDAMRKPVPAPKPAPAGKPGATRRPDAARRPAPGATSGRRPADAPAARGLGARVARAFRKLFGSAR